jgi:alanyl-tRNA synthetase
VCQNEGRGYVLRRVLRRAVRYGQQILGAEPGFFAKLAPVVAASFGDYFPELLAQEAHVVAVLEEEEAAFNSMLVRGIKHLNDLTEAADAAGAPKAVTGAEAFFLYDSLGFPLDLTELMAAEKGFKVDTVGFDAAMAAQKARSREATVAKRAAAGLGNNLVLAAEETAWLAAAGVPATDDAAK